ncbi:MAG: acetylornithine/succinylornithine family transaminase [Gammaproteobacteria bacterium]|nr:acetylornithine/succinylornithine family transaminase [Gammaproteobacteria bacterium]MYD75511.1 acetylornithine/succinylornithine family transaminase [Gammaproteobacteria bacterium]MYJ52380.1 acetylornithine/succinylornithine family transaminase [Gammaproteobacteria bacterium]
MTDLEHRYGHPVYPKREVEIVRGDGALLWDQDGGEYIDCAAGVGVANIGHANAAVAEAIGRQAKTLVTCPGIFYNDVRGQLMARLVSIAPPGLERVFLCNSGTEAIEAAIKFARLTTGRAGIVSAMRGFHGRTLGALSATFKYRDEFEPLLAGNRFVPFNNPDRLASSMDDDVAAVLLEIVQGEGGIRPADPEYIRAARELCDRHGAMLIVDEVQTGFGRTGRMFACEHTGVSPDIMTLAKAIAGGVPMGAVLTAGHIAPAIGKHGSTFGGNPLACSAALASIGYIESHGLIGKAEADGLYFASLLRDISSPRIREIRHLGLMIGMELKSKSRPVLDALLKRNVLALSGGPTVVRLLPPLVITREQIAAVARRIADALDETA